MEQAIIYIPLILSSLALGIVSFVKETKKNNKVLWLITAFIIWIGNFIWTLNKVGVLT
ncbi:MAG: hypothetical protein Q7S27_00730 [Nanoarchaeota archaeon]|nr:hypothetical protein [Nanoarchaeota archaeon]